MAVEKQILQRLYSEVFNGSYEMFSQVIDIFVAETPTSMRELELQHSKGDLKSVVHIIHTMKSNAAALGATRFEELCAKIETSARTGRIPCFRQWYEELGAEFSVCSEELRETMHEVAA